LAYYFDELRVTHTYWLCCRYLVPGWRMGWIMIHDRHNAFHEVINIRTLVDLAWMTLPDGPLSTTGWRPARPFTLPKTACRVSYPRRRGYVGWL